MEIQYINKNRYDGKKNKKNVSTSFVSKNKAITVSKSKLITHHKNKKIKKHKKLYKILKISLYLFILSIIIISIRLIFKDKSSPFIPIGKKILIENSDTISIGDYGITNLLNTKTNNVILSELEQYIYPMLLKIDPNYNIVYELINSIDKISNSEYVLHINPIYSITATGIYNNILEHLNTDTKYSFKFKNVSEINIINETTIKIKLKKDDPLFVYNLNIPIYINNSSIKKEYNIINLNNDLLTLNRTHDAKISLPKNITVKNTKNVSDAIDMYKNNQIDVFFSSYLNIENLIQNYDYNIKKIYGNQNIFLIGNPDSDLFNRIEVRKALSYGINKNDIILKAANNNGIAIDTPFIYNTQKYKYDIYAAENILLSNNYKKNNGIYQKYENDKKISLELSLIVNKNSMEKIAISNILKENFLAIGIKLNISILEEQDIINTINNKSYDLVLADIYLNEQPDILKLKKDLLLTDIINKKINNLNNSNLNDMAKNLNEIITAISDDLAIIGIYNKPTYIIYRKNINFFNNSKFNNIFNNFN